MNRWLLMVIAALTASWLLGCGGSEGTTSDDDLEARLSNTFTCLVDGRPFTAYLAGFTVREGRLRLSGYTREDHIILIDLMPVPTSAPAQYQLGPVAPDVPQAVHFAPDQADAVDTSVSGTVTITRLEARRCVGVFEFEAQNALDQGRTIQVTNGSFDLRN